ncbi:LOW QUALITY PROTEIN: hypothetical protein B0H65DRAFT_555542 [Neurospora tetraspora]|uniref:Ubiquitination network signaling protein n=1 Tax=Neurospora tetraspora TaxID=94610 RepID=A0AAE0JIT6_9PEZI|nr:LOW QUALITY PROTEIN: hypothetical protein B0H65DRAFT_555542 [Neurospora tetraspora]
MVPRGFLGHKTSPPPASTVHQPLCACRRHAIHPASSAHARKFKKSQPTTWFPKDRLPDAQIRPKHIAIPPITDCGPPLCHSHPISSSICLPGLGDRSPTAGHASPPREAQARARERTPSVPTLTTTTSTFPVPVRRMPRASNSAKRQQGANNQRDTRHEGGLVGPGKRIPKQQKSHQQLAALDQRPTAAVVDNAAPAAVPQANNNNNITTAANAFPALPDDNNNTMAAESQRRGSLGGAYSESESAESLAFPPLQSAHEENHRQINVNDAKNTNVHRDPGPVEYALTVLKSCPIYDTIAILIILMQLSPAFLAIVYMLFTLLTFVPPVTTSSGLTIADIFDGNQGTPSLTTLVCMDVAVLGIWLFLWAPMQQFILDLAQVVISLTLGGGGSSRTSTSNSIFLCVAIIGASQWTRQARWNGLSHLSTLFGTNRFFPTSHGGPIEHTVRAFEKKGPYGWGLVRYIREWERRDLQSQSQLDPEAGKTVSFSDSCSDAALMAADSDAHLQTSAGTKRRKQSAQPLWAALASTKIVMYELSHAASESAGSNATDIHNLGNAPFNTQPEQIWICYIGSDEFCFNTNFPDDETAGTPGPFYVRVNNAKWQPTRIIPIEGTEEDKHQGTRDIYGLTPLSNYACEFVSTRTDQANAKSRDPEAPAKAAPNNQRVNNVRHDSPVTTLRASIAAAEIKLADEKARLKAARKENNRRVNAAKKEVEKLTAAVQSAGGDDDKLKQKVAQNKIQEKRAEESIAQLEAELKELEAIPEELLAEYRSKQSTWKCEKARYEEARSAFKSFNATLESELKVLKDEQTSLQAKQKKVESRINKVKEEHKRITDANAQGLGEAERRRQNRATLEADIATAERHLTDRINSVRSMNMAKQAQISDMSNQIHAYLSSVQEDMAYGHAAAVAGGQYPQASNASTGWGMPPVGATAAAAAVNSTFANAPAQTLWPAATAAASGSSSLGPQTGPAALLPPPPIGGPFSNPLQQQQQSQQAAIGTPAQQRKARDRSSSMLSDISGFTESTDEDERERLERERLAISYGQNHQHQHSNANTIFGTPGSMRGAPPGFGFPTRQQRLAGNNGTFGPIGGGSSSGFNGFTSGTALGSGSGSGSGTGSAVVSVGSVGSGFASGGSASGSGVDSGRSSVRSAGDSAGSGSAEGSSKDPGSPSDR